MSPSALLPIRRRIQREAHLVKVRDIRDVDEVDDGESLDLVRDAIEGLVHRHALAVPVVPEAEHDDTVLLRLDCFVDVPARGEVR